MKTPLSSLRFPALLFAFVSMHAACTLIAESQLEGKPPSNTSDGGAAGGGGASTSNSSGGGSSGSGGSITLCGTLTCLDTQACCEENCVDLAADPKHCGSCGQACADGEKCCGAAGCGTCCNDAECGEDHVCQSGTCILKCSAPKTECGSMCADLQTTSQHCGMCGNDCLSGHACVDSTCQPGWVSMGTMNALSPRQRAASVWTGSAVFVWGGQDDQGVLSDGGLYDPKTDTWTMLASTNAPTARVDAVAVLLDKRVLVWGGSASPATGAGGLNSGKLYDLETSTWTDIGVAPIGRRTPVAVSIGTRVLIWGGTSSGTWLSGGAIFDPAAMPQWSLMSTSGAPSGRSGVAWAWSGTELFLFGGRPGGSGATNELLGYNPTTNVWRTLPTTSGPSGRFDAFGGWTGTAMLVYGGRDITKTYNDAFLFTPTPMDGSWASVTTAAPIDKRSAPMPRSGWAFTDTGKIVLAGGLDEIQALRLESQIYDCGMNDWGTSIPVWPSGSEHEYGVAVWTGTELVLWSGLDNGVLTAAGDRYRL